MRLNTNVKPGKLYECFNFDWRTERSDSLVCELAAAEDVAQLLDEAGAYDLREWVTGRRSLTAERAAEGETNAPPPRPDEWSFAGLSGDDVGRYVRELLRRDHGERPPAPIRDARAKGDRPPPAGSGAD